MGPRSEQTRPVRHGALRKVVLDQRVGVWHCRGSRAAQGGASDSPYLRMHRKSRPLGRVGHSHIGSRKSASCLHYLVLLRQLLCDAAGAPRLEPLRNGKTPPALVIPSEYSACIEAGLVRPMWLAPCVLGACPSVPSPTTCLVRQGGGSLEKDPNLLFKAPHGSKYCA